MTVTQYELQHSPAVAEKAADVDVQTDVERPVSPAGLPSTSFWPPGLTPKAVALAVGCFVAVLVLAIGAVIYWIGPLVHERQQRTLINTERTAIDNAAKDNEGLYRPTLPTLPPEQGSVVGILAIPVIGLQQAVVEGVGPSQTVAAPGHVPGTAGLGQPGNSAIVGRRSGYGGPFGQLAHLQRGDRIITATTEGQTVYVVSSVRMVTLTTPGTAATATTVAPSSSGSATTVPPATTLPPSRTVTRKPTGGRTGAQIVPVVTTTALYGPTKHNQLTLVTSGSAAPWNTGKALVVVARMDDVPYEATPQAARSTNQQGNGNDPEALAWLILTVLGLMVVFIGAVFLYRRLSLRSAYLLSTAPIVLLTILAAEAASHLLPAWL
jgi:sortase A